MCKKHWGGLPANVQFTVRKGTEAGQHTLRAHPTREWLEQAGKHVGAAGIKDLAIRVAADERVQRKFQNKDSKRGQEPEPIKTAA